ncbi:MAG: hypothetical protein M3O28_02075 [Actinomycetota bacterium]|nr:hypothetical protein [Actinomycetota bacterium]
MGNIGAQRMLLDVLGDEDLDGRSQPGKRSSANTPRGMSVGDRHDDARVRQPRAPRDGGVLTPLRSRD